MAKRKRKKSGLDLKGTTHSLPGGFWRQIGAVLMIAFAIIFVVSWFGSGGKVLDIIFDATSFAMGYALYLIPLALIFLAVETFRGEDNRVPAVVTIATALCLIWFSGIFGLFENADGPTGGAIGGFVNQGMLSITDEGVAIFIYILLIFITALFVLSISPITVIKKVSGSLKSTTIHDETTKNARIMKKAVETSHTDEPQKKNSKFKLNAGVPTLGTDDKDPKRTLFNRKDETDKPSQSQHHEPKSALVSINDPNWETPSLDLLERKQSPADAGNIQRNAQIIKDTLGEFSIDVEMEGANIGPRVTQYTLRPPSGVKLTKITALEANIALNLEAQSLRIEAPIPGQKAVGIEVPNVKSADVRLHGILDSKQWKQTIGKLNFAVGRDISGQPVISELSGMPHLLVAGQTGSGKSVMINTILASLLYRNSPSDMKIILVDPKQVEMAPYEDIPHLLTPIITEPDKTISALKWAVNEMERRYSLLAEKKVRDIASYNSKMESAGHKISVADEDGNLQEHHDGKMPYIIIVIDELADLMMAAPREVEALVVRLAQKARAVGIHLILATQRPSVDVITGLIKANIPARIAFTVAQQVDSRTILDQVGAEKLLGKGDMLMKTATMNKPKRIQGAWVTDEEIMKITDFLRLQSPPQYNNEVISQPVQINGKGGVVFTDNSDIDDDLYRDAVSLVIESRKASASMLQRRLRVGYSRASRLIDTMEEQGIIGPTNGNSSRPRDVLIDSLDEIPPI